MLQINGAWLTTNRTCNNQCAFCYAQHAKGTDMSFEDAKKCVDALVELGVKSIVLIGGEPTIYKHFFELESYISKKGTRVSVATNGRVFSNKDFAKKMIASGVSSVNISIKGFNEREYITITKHRGCAEMVLGYQNLCNLGLQPILSYVISQNDTNKIDELLAFMSMNKMDRILFQFVKPVVEPNSHKIMSMFDMGKMVKYIYEKMASSNIKSLHYKLLVKNIIR